VKAAFVRRVRILTRPDRQQELQSFGAEKAECRRDQMSRFNWIGRGLLIQRFKGQAHVSTRMIGKAIAQKSYR
jgi:hypothetical protein